MGFNQFWMLVTFQYRGLHHLDTYCTLIIEAWRKSNIHFDCRCLELWNACIISWVFIVLNVRDGSESKYPSIVFLSILHVFTFLIIYFACNLLITWPVHKTVRLTHINMWINMRVSAWDVDTYNICAVYT